MYVSSDLNHRSLPEFLYCMEKLATVNATRQIQRPDLEEIADAEAGAVIDTFQI
ncbi:MAG: hypothetical protein MUC48_09445 [Leptolyngbya sp. Prado105]|nr:hypothetical protein [Leptolyngbya sp. Prado105]